VPLEGLGELVVLLVPVVLVVAVAKEDEMMTSPS
jgi:hypothetical protein